MNPSGVPPPLSREHHDSYVHLLNWWMKVESLASFAGWILIFLNQAGCGGFYVGASTVHCDDKTIF